MDTSPIPSAQFYEITNRGGYTGSQPSSKRSMMMVWLAQPSWTPTPQSPRCTPATFANCVWQEDPKEKDAIVAVYFIFHALMDMDLVVNK